MIPHVLMEAANDRRLRRDDLRVLVIAHRYLDPYQFRPLKTALIGRHLHLQRSHAARALRRLVAFGFLVAGERDGRLATYRLSVPQSPMNSCTTGGTSRAA